MSATVFIVDDDLSVRRALVRLLSSDGLQVEAFASAAEFLARVPRPEHGCILLDIKMPRMTGLELQRELKTVGLDLPIVFLSAHANVPLSVRAMKDGALDILTKPFQEHELLDAVRRALALESARSRERADYEDLRQRYDSLTPRQRMVMTLVIAGKRNKEVAWLMGTSVKTVKVHRAGAMAKMQADSLPDLVRMAARLGLPCNAPATTDPVPKVQ